MAGKAMKGCGKWLGHPYCFRRQKQLQGVKQCIGGPNHPPPPPKKKTMGGGGRGRVGMSIQQGVLYMFLQRVVCFST